MRKFMTKKVGIVFAGVLATLFAAGAAFAYWTAGGGGTGTASTAAGLTGLTVNQTALATPLEPGVPAQTLSGTFGNTNDAGVYVTSVTAAITGVAGGAGACTSADYTLANEVMTVGRVVPVGGAVDSWTGATLAFNNTGVNQDGCKGATVTLTYTVL